MLKIWGTKAILRKCIKLAILKKIYDNLKEKQNPKKYLKQKKDPN
jgi:hypothetical protein